MLLFAFLIGFFAGLRSLTAPAATAWAAYLGWLKLERPLALIGSLPALAIFTLLAVFELVADKLPQIPSRTSPPGLIARIVMGGLTGACVSAGGGQGFFLAYCLAPSLAKSLKGIGWRYLKIPSDKHEWLRGVLPQDWRR